MSIAKSAHKMFTAALFKMPKRERNQDVLQLMKGQTVLHPDNATLFRNELTNNEKTWRNLRCILLSERSKSKKTRYCMIPTIRRSGKGKSIETRKTSMVASAGGKEG